MLESVIYALVIVSQNGTETTAAQFADRNACLTEARKVIEQGPNAYCIPKADFSQEYVNAQLDKMISILNHIRGKMEKTQ
jgi:hypothetical protein